MLNFHFSEKSLRLVDPPHFAWDFSRKMFLVLYSISLSDWPLLLEIFGNMCVVIICFPVYDVTNFEINLSFLIKLLFNMTEKARTKI